MKAEDLELSSEDETKLPQIENQNFRLHSKNSNIAQIKKIKINCERYRELLIEEKNSLLKEQYILQRRLQKYYDLESELKNLVQKIGLDINAEIIKSNPTSETKDEEFCIKNFHINLKS